MRKSPSLFTNAFFAIDSLAVKMCTASPSRIVGSPFPASVFKPEMKSVLVLSEGISRGYHASWVGLKWTFGLSGKKHDSSYVAMGKHR